MEFTQVINALNDANKIAIFVHINPDADCLGSAIALGVYLKKLNKSVSFFCDDEIHSNYDILGVECFERVLQDEYDLLVAVDCSDVMRIGSYCKYFMAHPNTVCIDHHSTNTNFAKINLVKQEVSTTVIIHEMLKSINYDFDKEIATVLYAGIIGDTGGLAYGDLTSKVFNIVAELVSYDVDIDKVSYYLLRRRSYGQLMLLKCALSSLSIDNNFASMVITLQDFEQTNTTPTDVFGLVNYAINIDEVDVAVCLCEYLPNKYQVSFRGKGSIDVGKLANVFGGGGHKNASGCRLFGNKDKCIEKIKKAVISL